jgi:hypothetical protein
VIARATLILLMVGCGAARADTIYLQPEDFLRETFGATLPPPQLLWLDQAAQNHLKPILGHPYPQARLRYWRAGGRTVWILEDIGREFPITAGFVVDKHAIDTARVLIYRESRGDEIHYPAFLKQFGGAHSRTMCSNRASTASAARRCRWMRCGAWRARR